MSEFEDKLRDEFRDRDYAHAYADEFLSTYIAAQIAAIRKQRDWTQQQLGQAAGMSQDRISRLESEEYGNYSLATLRRLASAFDVALHVSFEDFSSTIHRIASFQPDELRRPSREEEYQSGKLSAQAWQLRGRQAFRLGAVTASGAQTLVRSARFARAEAA